MKKWALVWIGLIVASQVFGQSNTSDSVISISGVLVQSSRLSTFTAGQKVISVDSITLLQNQDRDLSELISSSTSIQIKSYNYNGLSTIAFRGTSAQHTGIYWNGFQLNPSNSGLLDLSLVPAGLFNGIRIMYGGGSSLFGSGNIGGSIHLNNDPVFGKGDAVKLNLGTGSFGEYQAGAIYEKSKQGLYSKTALFFRTAENDFSYHDLAGEKKIQQNSAMLRYGLLQDLYGNLGKGQWGAHLWLQNNHREIPTSLTEAPNDTEQFDRSARGVISYRYPLQKGAILFRSAYFYDYFRYYDPDSLPTSEIDSEIETGKFSTEAVYSRALLKNGQFKTGVIYKLETGNSINWNGRAVRNQLGLFVLLMHPIPNMGWNVHLNLRQNFNNFYNIPFTPSLGAEGKLIGKLDGRLSISRNFRIPTFNDLFWVSSGNLDLLPEDSWNEEIGLVYSHAKDSSGFHYSISSTVFSSQVKNWIIWIPKGMIAEPQNIQEVWARGVEAEVNTGFRIGRYDFRLSGGYTYSRSTGMKKRWEYDQAYKKQLIYVPEHRFFGKLGMTMGRYSFSYNHSYTGLQYTTSDNLEYLPAFHTADIILDGSFLINKHQLLLQMQIRNIWDAEYQSLLNYPNPRRSLYLSVTFKLF